MDLHQRKFVILVEQLFQDLEFWYPYYRLQEAGAEVVVVGSGSAPHYTGKAGTRAAAETTADHITVAEFDGLIIPGGYAPDFMRRYPDLVNLVKTFDDEGKIVAAICHAGWMLASAGILEGRTVTSFFAIRDDLVHAGARWVDEPVCIDRNLITSRTPEDLPVFMQAVTRAAAGRV